MKPSDSGRKFVSIFLLTLLGATLLPTSPSAADSLTINLAKQAPSDIQSVGDDPFGKLVKYGHTLFTDTVSQIGPAAKDPANRYAGNQLNCQSCHLQGGSQPYASPLTGIWGQFPQYRGREGEVGTLEERVNGCMERSMNGKALPLDGREMKAFLAYMKWLSTGVPDGAKLVGAGTLSITEPARAADPAHGAQVYATNCASCHGADGQGQRTSAGGYMFPPLWGSNSYNDGAGMARVLVAAGFAKHTMPLGVTFDSPKLTDEDAYDVAGYMNSQPRPHKENLEKDFPNRLQKPVDAPYGPYVDGFSAEQHKLGPFEPIRTKMKELVAQSRQAK